MLRATALRAVSRIGRNGWELMSETKGEAVSRVQNIKWLHTQRIACAAKKDPAATIGVEETVVDPAQAIAEKRKYIYGITDEMLAGADDSVRAIYSLENASRVERNKVAIHDAIDRVKTWEKDTGSAQAQVAVLTTRIHYMITHMREHPKDVHSRRGLELMVQKRRKLLLYLRRKNLKAYLELLKEVNLRPLVTPKSSKFR